MIKDWLNRALNNESMIGFAVAKTTVTLTDVKLISYLKLNIFEVFFCGDFYLRKK